jgi:AraC-like DNA-binding protein
MAKKIYRLRERSFASLKAIGFAIQHFKNYCNSGSAVTHGHDILELNFIVSGTAFHRIGEVERPCPPGALGIVHYGQEHSLATDENGIEVINLYLDPANHALPVLPAAFSNVVGTLFPPAVLPGMPVGLTSFLQFENHQPLVSLLLYGCAEQEAMRSGYEIAMESVLRIFLIACARQAMEQGVETMVADHSKWQAMERVRLKLESSFTGDHTLAELAAVADVSEQHLCRRFKEYTGLTPFSYLAQRRIRAAMQELRSSNDKILAVAFSSGFNDIGHFNRKFREFANCSPSQYRQGHACRADATAAF